MKYQILKAQYFKGVVFLLSVHEGGAYWSTHRWEGGTTSLLHFKMMFGSAHDAQVQAFIDDSRLRDEKEGFTDMTIIEDHTAKNN